MKNTIKWTKYGKKLSKQAKNDLKNYKRQKIQKNA